MAARWITALTVLSVTAAWLAALAAGLKSGDFTALEVVTPIEALVAGYATGIKITRGKNE